MVPFLDLSLQYDALKNEIDSAIQSVFKDSSFVLGPALKKFEDEFARYCHVDHCVGLNSGTAALHLALLAMGVGPGDEVITAANSFIATAEAISFCGAEPRFVDALLDTANLNSDMIEAAITHRTKVIIPVHLYGQPAEIDKVLKIAAAHKIMVLEDACQAHGAVFHGERVGTFGHAAAYSFYPGKNLGAAGDGGAVVTNDAELAARITLLRNHGSEQKYHHDIVGHNFRLDSIQAAILSAKLPHLDLWNKKRREIARFYDEKLTGVHGISPMCVIDGCEPVYHLYVIRTAERDVVLQQMKEMRIASGIHYPIPIHLQPAYQYLNLEEGSFPVSEELSKSVVSLPIYPDMPKADQERVVASILKASELMKSRS
ncbi:MAG: DegT/DnrJ/EryC1/StrS family aminotransferase [Cyanobacteria bacterium SZAS-4]|nr:DegT/DnrJ/EryC1/StrS family aminotransferase [Cyanobacteria bacterium SZAS-4]